MWEALIAAAATAVVSAGSAAAMAAAKRSGETRDAVLILRGQVEALDGRIAGHVLDAKTQMDRQDRRMDSLDSRVTALENGWVDRRRHARDE